MESEESTNKATLVSMGFHPDDVELALSQTGTLEAAMEWLVAMSEEETQFVDELKMVLVVRKDLKMSSGKVASQCVHAALGAYRAARDANISLLLMWEQSGEKTVCLACTSEEQMQSLFAAARNANIPSHVVCDAGRTEIDPGSRTVLAIGPELSSKINLITGSLGLYK